MAAGGIVFPTPPAGDWKEANCRWENCGNRPKLPVGKKCVTCDRCYHVTCLRCNASHEGVSCKTYQEQKDDIKQQEVTVQEDNEQKEVFIEVTCLFPNCDFQTLVVSNAGQVTCSRCGHTTCLHCNAVHEFKTCDEYQAAESGGGENDVESTATLQCDACGQREPAEHMDEVFPCGHNVCTTCTEKAAESTPTYLVSCPVREDGSHLCSSHFGERQLAEHVSEATLAIRNELKNLPLRRCATKDCDGRCNVRAGTKTFKCLRCGQTNCVECGAIHDGMSCRQHVEWLVAEQEGNYTASDLITRLSLKDDGIPCATEGCTGVGCRMDMGSYCRTCGQYTCLECRVVHDFETCDQYKFRTRLLQVLKDSSDTDSD